jgi:hypothetical protein
MQDSTAWHIAGLIKGAADVVCAGWPAAACNTHTQTCARLLLLAACVAFIAGMFPDARVWCQALPGYELGWIVACLGSGSHFDLH